MDDKITIIEGPPPTFEAIGEAWALGLNESPSLYNVVMTRLRTYNGPGLVERCYRAWHKQDSINLEYRSSDGLTNEAPILAVRTFEIDDGQMLVLWLRLEYEETETETGNDDYNQGSDDDPGDLGL